MSLIIAGERSGIGKTTVTMAILAYWSRHIRDGAMQSFKVGPDYIDPMFHTYITGRPCRNLDPVLTSEAYVQACFAQHVQGAEAAVIEGVMGVFDGASRSDDWASTAHIARLLGLPLVLVLDCSRLSRSIAALVHGYTTFDSRLTWAGLVLNRVGSDRHLDFLKSALELSTLPILGIIRRHDDIAIPGRHLGLIPTAELPELDAHINRLATQALTWFDWETLLPLTRVERHSMTQLVSLEVAEGGEELRADQNSTLNTAANPVTLNALQTCIPAPPIPASALTSVGAAVKALLPHPQLPISQVAPRIVIAYDRAFNFYYADNFDLLRHLGAELIFWSPMADRTLPPNVGGLYLGGGFPEIFAQELSSNASARAAVRSAILTGMPVYAECGGLMYLCDRLIDYDGNSWPLVGAIPAEVSMTRQLTLGYRCATTRRDSPLMIAGTVVWGHEFHHSALHSQAQGAIADPLYDMRGYHADSPTVLEGWQHGQMHASYLHLHWGTCPYIPKQFLNACAQFAASRYYPMVRDL